MPPAHKTGGDFAVFGGVATKPTSVNIRFNRRQPVKRRNQTYFAPISTASSVMCSARSVAT